MKKVRAVLLLSACAALAGACALEASNEASAPRPERVYVTGSNIAKRNNPGDVSVLNREEAERDMTNRTNMPMPMPGGAH
jgi:outer membrane receptor for ferrienterochelin and colicin